VSDGPTLRIVDEPDDDPDGAVPAPVPPDDPEAWYAPDVRAQYEAAPGVVATVRERDGGRFGYDVREPPLSPGDEAALERVRDHFSAVRHRRPLTRVGVVERAERGFEPKYDRALDRLLDASAAARRRIDYHALRDLRLLGDVTPLALDDRIEVADVGDERELVVHTETFAPLETGIDADADYVERVAAERLSQYAVGFAGLSVDVVVYRERLLGSDAFETKYAVLEPDLLPGDEALIEECKERIWETTVNGAVDDREAFVAEHARRFLSRRLTARNTRAWLDAAAHRVRAALADRGLGVPPVDSRYARDRLDDLTYYVLRDFVGEGILTVPIRDPNLEDVEALANRVVERGLPPYLLREIDLVVFPRQVDGERYVSRAVELLSAEEYEALDPEAKRSPAGSPKRGGAGVVDKGGESVYYNTVAWRDADGEFRFPGAPDADGAAAPGEGPRLHAFGRIADHTDREVDAVTSEFVTKRRYVEYLVREGVDDADALFEFLADLRTDEAATVERAARTMDRASGSRGRSDDREDPGGRGDADGRRRP
jgi:type IV secretory pathway ATPase VirB11/archaellum biosynthesis ATPase